jgi:hypothetical protein
MSRNRLFFVDGCSHIRNRRLILTNVTILELGGVERHRWVMVSRDTGGVVCTKFLAPRSVFSDR